MEKYIAIGDIHGCYNQLIELYNKLLKYDNYKLVFLGDYIDRGPDSKKVLNFLQTLNESSIFLIGNHEMMLLDIDTFYNDKSKLIEFLNKKNFTFDDFLWIKNRCLFKYETENYFFSHAGINPNKKFNNNSTDDFLWSTSNESYKHLTKKFVIHGHVSINKVSIIENNININTGCGKNGKLSAIVLPDMKIISSDSIGEQTQVY